MSTIQILKIDYMYTDPKIWYVTYSGTHGL